MNKRAEMGVGTLIVFIAMLLVAAVAAGVLITTIGSLQEKSLSTGEQAESQISTTAQTIEVSATDGQNGYLSDFQQLIKLAPGSDPIKLDYVIFTFNTEGATATLKYKGTTGTCRKSNSVGYNTWITQSITSAVGTSVDNFTLAEDLDDDNSNDYVYLHNVSGNDYLYVHLSTAGTLNVSLGANVDGAGGVLAVNNQPITDGTTTYGYVTLNGPTSGSVINTSVTFTVEPYNEYQGYFSAVYEQEGSNHIEGNLQRGDIVKLCYEAPENIDEDAEIRLNFIPKMGTATLTTFVTPDVISTQRVYLYP